MAALIDASVVIAAERGQIDPGKFETTYADTSLALASITASELLHGLHRLRASGRKVRAEAFVEAILANLPLVPFDLACARAHARLGATLQRRGVTIGAHDLIIAATALARGLSVITRDRRSFPNVPDLSVDLL